MTTQAATASSLVKGLNHTSYTVYDLDRILGFLTEGLGFHLIDKSPRDPVSMSQITGVKDAHVITAFVQAPGHRIELINYQNRDDRVYHNISPSHAGFSHLAFDVTDIDEVVEVARRFKFEPVHEPLPVSAGPNVGSYCAYLRDPEGLTVEVIGPRVR